MDKLIIIGAEGLVGSAVSEVFTKKGYSPVRADHDVSTESVYCDITNESSVRELLSGADRNIIILAAALSNVEYCEEHPEESERINLGGLSKIIKYMKPADKLVFFSSDYVFDGTCGPYSEDDEPNPLCIYGRHKRIAEHIVKDSVKDHLVIRTTWVYGPERKGKNFVLSLARRLRSGESVKVPSDQKGSPTYSINLAEVLEALIRKNKKGTYNIVGPDVTDRYSFAMEVCRVFDLPEEKVIPVETKDLGQKAKRPLDAGLTTGKIEKDACIPLVPYGEGLRIMKERSLNRK